MNLDDSKLEDMLRAAGRAEPPPGQMPADLAPRVRQLRARRRRNRLAASGLAAAAVLLVGIVWMGRDGQPSSHVVERPDKERDKVPASMVEQSAADAARLRAEIASLSAEADDRRRFVEELMARREREERNARLDEQLGLPDALNDAQLEIEKAAFLLVDGVEHRSAAWSAEAAAAEYRRILEHFPNTGAARTAATRLKELTGAL